MERGDGFAEGSAVFVGSFEAVDVEEGDGAVVEGCGGGGGDGQRLAARADELCAAVAEHMVELGGAEFEGGVDGGGAEPEQREPEDEVLDPVLRHEDDPAPGGDVETAAEKRGDPVDRLIHLGVGEHPFEVADGDAAGLLGGHDAVQVFERRPLPAERAVALDGVAGELVEQAGLLEQPEQTSVGQRRQFDAPRAHHVHVFGHRHRRRRDAQLVEEHAIRMRANQHAAAAKHACVKQRRHCH